MWTSVSQVVLVVKNSPANAKDARDASSIPGSGRSPGEGNGNPLQYSCLGNPMDRGTWQATVHWVTKSWTWLKLLGSLWKCGEKIPGEPTCFRQEGKKNNFEIHRALLTRSNWPGESESESRSVVSYSLWPHGLYSPWNSPGSNTGVGSLSLLQGIFPTQGLNPGFPHCRWILYQLSHKGSPRILEWVVIPFSRGFSQPRNWTVVSCIAGSFLPTELSGKLTWGRENPTPAPSSFSWWRKGNIKFQPSLVILSHLTGKNTWVIYFRSTGSVKEWDLILTSLISFPPQHPTAILLKVYLQQFLLPGRICPASKKNNYKVY